MMGKLFLVFVKYFLLAFLFFFLLQALNIIGEYFDEGSFYYAWKSSFLLVLGLGTVIILFSAFAAIILTAKHFKNKTPSKLLNVFCAATAVTFALITYAYSNYLAPKIRLDSLMDRYIHILAEEPSPEIYLDKKKYFEQNPNHQEYAQIGQSIDSLVQEKATIEKDFLAKKKEILNRENQISPDIIIERLQESHNIRIENIEKTIRKSQFERYGRIVNAVGAFYLVFLGFFIGLKFNSQKNISLLAMAIVGFQLYLGFMNSLENTYIDQTNTFEVWFCTTLSILVFLYFSTNNKKKPKISQ